jgi:ferric-dicitrate binding protein FerR (iron transport regulator)
MDLTGLSKLAEHVARQEDALIEGAPADERVRRAIAERAVSRAERRSRRNLRAGFVPALAVFAVAAVALVFWGFSRSEPASVTFTVGDPPRDGVLREWVSASASSELGIRFSDGSRAKLMPGSRGRVVRLSPGGAELVVEAGRALVEVVPRPGADYRLRTGPFNVEVTGTRFRAGWYPDRDEFELELYEGRVRVEGCGLSDGVSVEAGQRLEASCHPAKFSVRPRGDTAMQVRPNMDPKPEPAAATAEPAQQVAAAPAVGSGTGAAPARSSMRPVTKVEAATPAVPAPVSWSALARQGHFRRAYEAAAAAGFEAECARAPADELLLLGDAARLSGHGDRAVHAYTTLRRRFPGSGAAAQSAFHLGRLAPNASGGQAGGARWFEAYLKEQPGGPLAEAALGRMLEAEIRRGNGAEARSLAKTYLERHPLGPHAETARKILAAPAED